jgi:glutamyl-tRNA reductase
MRFSQSLRSVVQRATLTAAERARSRRGVGELGASLAIVASSAAESSLVLSVPVDGL